MSWRRTWSSQDVDVDFMEPEVVTAGDEVFKENGAIAVALKATSNATDGPKEVDPKSNVPLLFQG